MENGDIYRVGRNSYRIAEDSKRNYSYLYSELSLDLAKKIEEQYPELDFRIFELVQLNEFVNHQIAHNVIFISVESGLGTYVFDSLKERYTGKIILNPSVETFHQYWSDDMIIIKKLVSESPKGERAVWETKLEKMLVDLVSVEGSMIIFFIRRFGIFILMRVSCFDMQVGGMQGARYCYI